MRTVGQIIQERREAMGLTLAKLADEIGATKSYLSMIENHRVPNPPSHDLLVGLEKALEIKDGELMRSANWQSTPPQVRQQYERVAEQASRARDLAQRLKQFVGRRKDGAKNLDELFRSGKLNRWINSALKEETPSGKGKKEKAMKPIVTPRQRVPLINRVAAGYPTDFSDLGYPARVADEYVECPDLSDPDAFAARVVGDSMLPDYRAGDTVVFSPAAKVTEGCDCFVRLEPDHESTFKRVFFEQGGKLIRLQPLNPKFAARTLKRDQVAGLYRAVKMIKDL